jgi:hypothetical protein
MTDADLDRIESALAARLPVFYRRFMLDYPQWLPAKQPKWMEPVTDWEFANDPDRVVGFNRYVRDAEPGEFFDGIPWPHHYFVIGSEDEQNWYVLDLKGGTETVYLYHHDEGEFTPYAQSLREYAEKLVQWWEDIERDNQM